MRNLKEIFDIETERARGETKDELAFYNSRVIPAVSAFVSYINTTSDVQASFVPGYGGVHLTGSGIAYFDAAGNRSSDSSNGKWNFEIRFSDKKGFPIGSAQLQLDGNTPELAIGEYGGKVKLDNENDRYWLSDYLVRQAARNRVAAEKKQRLGGAPDVSRRKIHS